MRNFNLPTAILLAGVLTTTGCSSEEPPTYIPIEDKQVINMAGRLAAKYWSDRNLKQVAETKIEYVEGNKKYKCGTEELSDSITFGILRYCRSKKSVIMNRPSLYGFVPPDMRDDPKKRAAVFRTIIYHEYTHAAQAARGDVFSKDKGEILVAENQADSCAGVLSAKFSPDDRAIMEQVYPKMEDREQDHGSGQARLDIYKQGYDQGICLSKQAGPTLPQ
ncbi:MAG TPA: hypothetical protein VF733_02640 [Candidatus Saccharimonadales bacterium]